MILKIRQRWRINIGRYIIIYHMIEVRVNLWPIINGQNLSTDSVVLARRGFITVTIEARLSCRHVTTLRWLFPQGDVLTPLYFYANTINYKYMYIFIKKIQFLYIIFRNISVVRIN